MNGQVFVSRHLHDHFLGDVGQEPAGNGGVPVVVRGDILEYDGFMKADEHPLHGSFHGCEQSLVFFLGDKSLPSESLFVVELNDGDTLNEPFISG